MISLPGLAQGRAEQTALKHQEASSKPQGLVETHSFNPEIRMTASLGSPSCRADFLLAVLSVFPHIFCYSIVKYIHIKDCYVFFSADSFIFM